MRDRARTYSRAVAETADRRPDDAVGGSPRGSVRDAEASSDGGPSRTRRASRGTASLVGHVVGGGLIGAAEVVPGVSGGTVALVVGLYDRLIGAADTVVRAAQALVPGRAPASDARRRLAEVPWGLVLPVVGGMLTALVLGAALLEPLVEEHPVRMRAVFLGLVAASLVVPLRMVGWVRSARDLAWVVGGAVVAGVLVSFPPAEVDEPFLPAVALAAAVAVSALVLPGVSGSFLLLSVGLYDSTIAAVNDRDLVYLLVFATGAAVGLATVVRGVRWLLTHRRRVTLLLMTGLMVGSLRALWPWQDDDRALLAPSGGSEEIALVAGLALAAAAVVLALVAREVVLERRAVHDASPDVDDHDHDRDDRVADDHRRAAGDGRVSSASASGAAGGG